MVTTGEVHPVLRKPEKTAAVLAKIEPGVIGRLLSCSGDYCRVEAGGYRGWMERKFFWGTYPNENFE
jgi:SH3-like domain-containing protein